MILTQIKNDHQALDPSQPEESFELIGGEVIHAWPQDWSQGSLLSRLQAMLAAAFPSDYLVLTRPTLEFSPRSRIEPSFAIFDQPVVLGDCPTSASPHLLIALANPTPSSQRYQREVKASLYAASHVGEYWLVDIMDRELQVYSHPTPDKRSPFGHHYARVAFVSEFELVRPKLDPTIALSLMDLFSSSENAASRG